MRKWLPVLAAILFSLPVSAFSAENVLNSGVPETSAGGDSLDLLNVRIRPIGLMFGSPGVDLDIGVARSWSLGPSVQFFQNSLTNSRTIYLEAGAQATYFFNHDRFGSSWFVRGGLYFLRYDFVSTRLPTDATLNYFITTGLLGYEFRLTESGLNTTLGTGLSIYANAVDTGVEPVLEWTVGWAL